MMNIAKTLIVTGSLIVLIGLVVSLMEKVSGVGKLPGDIIIKREDFTFYFPITTCILISVFLSAVLFILSRK